MRDIILPSQDLFAEYEIMSWRVIALLVFNAIALLDYWTMLHLLLTIAPTLPLC